AHVTGVRRSVMHWAAWVAVAVLGVGCGSPDVDRTTPAVELGEHSFHATLEAYAGAPIVSGNDVRILLNGDKIFPALLGAIGSARTPITYAQHFSEEGPVADDVVAALAERCRAGVPAHVLLDGVGTVSMPAQHIEALKAARCNVRTFRPLRPWALRRANNRNHRRILVDDGRVGVTGGSGGSRKWMRNVPAPHHWGHAAMDSEAPGVPR